MPRCPGRNRRLHPILVNALQCSDIYRRLLQRRTRSEDLFVQRRHGNIRQALLGGVCWGRNDKESYARWSRATNSTRSRLILVNGRRARRSAGADAGHQEEDQPAQYHEPGQEAPRQELGMKLVRHRATG